MEKKNPLVQTAAALAWPRQLGAGKGTGLKWGSSADGFGAAQPDDFPSTKPPQSPVTTALFSLSFVRGTRCGSRRSPERGPPYPSPPISTRTRANKLQIPTTLFICLINYTFQLVFPTETLFLSHNKSANDIFQPAYQLNRTGPTSL
jgi:hypothetical protein